MFCLWDKPRHFCPLLPISWMKLSENVPYTMYPKRFSCEVCCVMCMPFNHRWMHKLPMDNLIRSCRAAIQEVDCICMNVIENQVQFKLHCTLCKGRIAFPRPCQHVVTGSEEALDWMQTNISQAEGFPSTEYNSPLPSLQDPEMPTWNPVRGGGVTSPWITGFKEAFEISTGVRKWENFVLWAKIFAPAEKSTLTTTGDNCLYRIIAQ